MNDDLARDILEELRNQTAANEEALRIQKEMRDETRRRLDESAAMVSMARKEARWTLIAFVVLLAAMFALPHALTWWQMRGHSHEMEADQGVEEILSRAYQPSVKKFQAAAYAQSGQYEMLDVLEDSLLRAFPHDAEVAQILAKAHFDRGHLDLARELFEVSEGLLHDDLNVRHLEAIARREASSHSTGTTK